MTERRKKIVLTIKQKLDLIQKLECGESTSKLANEYSIGTQTVRDINKNKAKLLTFSNNCRSKVGPLKRKSMKKSSYEQLDNALIHWLNENRNAGVQVSGPMCAKQAKLFHASLGLDSEFSKAAVHGWLSRFKQRYGLQDNTRNSVKEDIDNVICEIKKEKVEEYKHEGQSVNVISPVLEESTIKTENDVLYFKHETEECLSTTQQIITDHISTLPNRTNILPNIYNEKNVIKNCTQSSRNISSAEDEFDLFGKSIAMQLRQLPLRHALICQEQLHNIIVQYRLSLMQSGIIF